jgi:hypothetical protein
LIREKTGMTKWKCKFLEKQLESISVFLVLFQFQ